jgi:hypothetical protein
MSSASAVRVRSTKVREIDEREVDASVASTSEPIGSAARRKRRQPTPPSIRSSTTLASGSREAKCSWVRTLTSSRSSAERTRGRRIRSRRPPSVTEPRPCPWRPPVLIGLG